MIIATYETRHPEVPEPRRWIAQIEKIAGRFYVTFHGATEDDARTKAEKFIASIPVKAKGDENVEPTPVLDAVPARPRRCADDLV